VFGRAAPCTCRCFKPRQRQQQQQKLAFRGLAGRCRSAETPQVRPCRLGSRIHAADTPQSDTVPPSTGSRRCWQRRPLERAAVGRCRPWSTRLFCQISSESSTHGVDLPCPQPWLARSTVSAKNHPRMAWIYRGSLPLVGANLGWHALRYPRRTIHAWRGSTAAACLCWVPTLVGTLYGIREEPSTRGVDLPRQPASGGCQPWLARSTVSAKNHPRMAWIYRGRAKTA
jgi:hypothetical protein